MARGNPYITSRAEGKRVHQAMTTCEEEGRHNTVMSYINLYIFLGNINK